MDSTPVEKPAITLGPIRLEQEPDGTLLCRHEALRVPIRVDEKQLQRWLMKLLRDAVVA